MVFPPKIAKAIGVLGTIVYLVIFIRRPNFPTPDKIIVLLTFVFMIFGQAKEMLKCFLPFVLILLAYESFRGIADSLNTRVNFTWMINVDRAMFGGTLPTTTLQKWFWHGRVAWYDFALYICYMLHFVMPIGLAIVVWKNKVKKYWQVVTAYIVTSFSGFLVFLAFPAAPPWMARDFGYIEKIQHISGEVWWALGLKDFPTVYSEISPNQVAAVPSLHAAYATLFALFVTTLFKTRWRFAAWIYPAAIYFGTVYMGEHYFIDEILGGLLAVVVFFASPYITKKIIKFVSALKSKFKPYFVKGVSLLKK